MKNFLIFLTIVAIGTIIFLNSFMAKFIFRDEVNDLCSSEYKTTSFLLSGEYRQCLTDIGVQRSLVRQEIKEIEKNRAEILARIPQLQSQLMETVKQIGQEKFYTIDQKLLSSFGTYINFDNLDEKNKSAAKTDGMQMSSDIKIPDQNRIAELFYSGQIPSRLLRVTMQRCMFSSSNRSADSYESAGFGCWDRNGNLHSFEGGRFDGDWELIYLSDNSRIPIDLFIEVQIHQLVPGMNSVRYEVMGLIVQPEMFAHFFDGILEGIREKYGFLGDT